MCGFRRARYGQRDSHCVYLRIYLFLVVQAQLPHGICRVRWSDAGKKRRGNCEPLRQSSLYILTHLLHGPHTSFFQFVIGGGAICLGFVWRRSYWGKRLSQWAEENNLILLHFRGAMFFEGPGKWMRTSHQQTFRVQVRDQDGKEKKDGSPMAAIGMCCRRLLNLSGKRGTENDV